MESRGLLAGLVVHARRSGWACTDTPLSELLQEAEAVGVSVIPTRRGDGPIGVLRPVEAKRAHPRSLSASYGLGRLPLHTDGAHHMTPPDVIVLEARRARDCGSTHLWRIDPDSVPTPALDALSHGVFTVGSGRSAFLAHAVDGHGRVRFDPGCMRPADDLARSASRWLDSMWDQACPFTWAQESRCIVIDNTRTLHGRPDAPNQGRELHRIMLEWGDHGEPR